MNYLLISVSSNDLLSLRERQKYVSKLFMSDCTYQTDKIRNQGFIYKFASSIGFKPVLSYIDNRNRYFEPKVYSPDDYLTPLDLLYEGMRTPVQTFEIMEFYIPIKKISHPKTQFCYNTIDISEKFTTFFQKVFPNLQVRLTKIDKLPDYPSKTFLFEYFYRSIGPLPVTIESSIPELLSKEDIEYILPKLQTLTEASIDISQYPCEVCEHNSFGKNKYHIEIVYLSRNGNDISDQRKSEYLDSLFENKISPIELK